jgi:beta-galactosidase
MRFRLCAQALIGAFCLSILASATAAFGQSTPAAHTFTVAGGQFLMDGKPYQIIAGEMHYPRVPREYWRDRFRKARAMGLNTITTYVFWNLHEPQPGVFDFSGQNDVAEYIREAQQEGLNVILRPGPYVCAEWELGGYPSWLLKDRGVVLRSDEPKYTEAVERWFARLGKELSPLLLRNGGPIIAVQVENEYGSFGNDHAYMGSVAHALEKSGLAPDVRYTADGADEIPRGSLPEFPAVVNFGTGDAQRSFAKLESLRADGPRMSGEYWAGWFDHWGEKHHETDGDREAHELEWMLRKGYSVNIYMFHGGTSFGWMNGANSNGSNYQPDTTSYDYDAPLDEQGTPRKKYFAFRDVIAGATGHAAPELPASTPVQAFPVGSKMESASLWRNLPKPVESKTLLTMEDLNQSYGYVLYRTRLGTGLNEGDGGELVIDGLHDYAQIYIDQTLVGTLDRRTGNTRLTLPRVTHAATLDILVENSGRVNYTKVIRNERKGITGSVSIGGKTPAKWEIFSLPMNDLAGLHFADEPCTGPCFYRTTIKAGKPADTYLDTSSMKKGMVWLNQRALGRFWFIGPQFALYVPGPWLKAGANEIVFFDLDGSSGEKITSAEHPIFGGSISERN